MNLKDRIQAKIDENTSNINWLTDMNEELTALLNDEDDNGGGY